MIKKNSEVELIVINKNLKGKLEIMLLIYIKD